MTAVRRFLLARYAKAARTARTTIPPMVPGKSGAVSGGYLKQRTLVFKRCKLTSGNCPYVRLCWCRGCCDNRRRHRDGGGGGRCRQQQRNHSGVVDGKETVVDEPLVQANCAGVLWNARAAEISPLLSDTKTGKRARCQCFLSFLAKAWCSLR